MVVAGHSGASAADLHRLPFRAARDDRTATVRCQGEIAGGGAKPDLPRKASLLIFSGSIRESFTSEECTQPSFPLREVTCSQKPS